MRVLFRTRPAAPENVAITGRHRVRGTAYAMIKARILQGVPPERGALSGASRCLVGACPDPGPVWRNG